MTEEKEVHGTISSLPGAFVIAGLTGNLVGSRCPIGVGHDGGEGSAWHHIVIAWCYRHCRLDRQSGGVEMPDRGRA